MLAAQVDTSQATFSWSNPVKLFDNRYTTYSVERAYDVSLDDRRFLVIKDNQPETSASMTVVLNWVEELKTKLPPE
jgi:hypothetical protein